MTVATDDLGRAQAFYDALFGIMAGSRYLQGQSFTAWDGGDPERPGFTIGLAEDGHPACAGDPGLIAIQAHDAGMVDRLHAKALALGARDQAAPGRLDTPDGPLYVRRFCDPDGNPLCFFAVLDG
ncbi:MAG: VOC family protein [Rhodothalassiaceae bacterium]